jgi:hypothetical protein
MAFSKTAAYNQARAEIIRSQNTKEQRYTISLYNFQKDRWIKLGNIGSTAAREFERRYIEHRVEELLKVS